MKAVRIHDYGDASVLNYEDAPRPKIGATDVLIRVHAASVNPVDWKIREGYLKAMLPYTMPLTLGWDVSGVVDEVGAEVASLRVGDEVYSRPEISKNGTYAQFVAVSAEEVALKPSSLSHAEAASVPLAGLTAWQALFVVAKLQKGQTVLIHAASGGVGSFAVQMAHNAGATVIATASAARRQHVLEFGADVVVDYRKDKFEDHARNVDVVLDPVGGETLERSFSTLKKGGVVVSVAATPSLEMAEKYGVRAEFLMVQPDAASLAQMAKQLDRGKLKVDVGHRFELAEAAAAHQLSQSGKATGKIVLDVKH